MVRNLSTSVGVVGVGRTMRKRLVFIGTHSRLETRDQVRVGEAPLVREPEFHESSSAGESGIFRGRG